MAVSEEARRKAEDEANRLAIERVSLLLELETSKDEVFAFQAQALKEKKALKEAYEEGFDLIFNYGYGCCALAHNICGSQPMVPNGMQDKSKPLSPEFFINPRCPPGAVLVKAVTIDVRFGEVMIASRGRFLLQSLRWILARRSSISLPPRLGLVMSLILPLRVTGESEEPDVFGDS